jgi:23S rRNA pseudouridine2604 synthase
MRINKYLNGAGVASRREADRLIEAGKVKINGRVAGLGDQISEGDIVEVGGRKILPLKQATTIVFHKPVGIIVTTDAKSPDNVMEAIRRSKKTLPNARLFPVGRLDVASSGLLLLTDDTALADRLMRPDSGTEKEYDVGVNKAITEEFLQKMRDGVRILGLKTRKAKVEQVDNARFRIVLTEGKNRQIRRMCEALGYSVLKLDRRRVGGVELDELPEGEWRFLTEQESASFRA